jgi:hypothetical protein
MPMGTSTKIWHPTQESLLLNPQNPPQNPPKLTHTALQIVIRCNYLLKSTLDTWRQKQRFSVTHEK